MTPAEKQAFDAMREALEKHGSAPLDWACVKCRPDSHCLKKDFLCLFHAALAAADAVAEQYARHGAVAKTRKAYIDVLIDELLIPSSAMSASDLEALHREVASVLYYVQTPFTPQAPQPMPDPTKMTAALRDIPLGTMLGLPLTEPSATSLSYQVLARKTLETDAERMAGAREKMMDDYSSDILARQGDDPKCE